MAIQKSVVSSVLLSAAVAVALYSAPVLLPFESGEAHAKRIKVKIRGNPLRGIERAVRHETRRGIENVGRETKRAEKNIRRSTKHVEEAVDATGHMVERHARNQRKSLEAAVTALAKGDLETAYKEYSVRNLQRSSRIAARATQESRVLHVGAQIAAASLGGGAPGAALFAAWHTFETTGDFDLALKAGLLSGASVAIGGAVADMPSATFGDYVARASVAGGGAYTVARAAGAGDSGAEKALMLALGQQIAIGLWELGANANREADDPYTRFSHEELQPATASGYCAATAAGVAAGCAPPDDLARTNGYNRAQASRSVNVAGLEAKTEAQFVLKPWPQIQGGASAPFLPLVIDMSAGENGILMRIVGSFPGMNALARMHDEWMNFEGQVSYPYNVLTILPAMAVTYAASGAELQLQVTESATKDHQEL